MPFWMFMFVGALAVISALGVVLQRHPVHSLLALVVTLMAIAVLFIGMGAVTVGFLQAIVYVGAIMVLFLFVIWLLNLQATPVEPGHLALKFFAAIGVAALAAELFVFFARATAPPGIPRVMANYGSIGNISTLLFTDYLIAFEITSVLLLAAVIGAVALARRVPAAAPAREAGAGRSEGW